MKNLINKILLVALVTVLGGALAGCNPELQKKEFSVAFKDFGPGYVSLNVTVPYPMTAPYVIVPEEKAIEEGLQMLDEEMLKTVVLMSETRAQFYRDGVQQLLDYEIEENKHYFVYLVGVLGEGQTTKLYTFEFDSGTFTFDQLATTIAVLPDGFKMFLKMPKSVNAAQYGQPGSRAIRFNHSDIMTYNLLGSNSDEYKMLLNNGDRWVNKDTVIVISDATNWGESGSDSNLDGVVDSLDKGVLWNPAAPGEPTIFLAGEFEWMQEPWYGVKDSAEKAALIQQYQKDYNVKNPADDNYVIKGFYYPAGWNPGYYLPCIDSTLYWNVYGGAPTRGAGAITDFNITSPIDASWTGAFQRKIFRTRMPDKLDADIKVEIQDLRSVDATVRIVPDKNIYRYIFTVLDDASYREMLKLIDDNEDYLQWAVTSYISFMYFGSMEVVAGNGETSAPIAEMTLSEYLLSVPSQTKFHVLVTGMSGEIGSPQCFYHTTFSTPAKTKTSGPEIEVTAMPEKATPYAAAFNVKCVSTESNPLVTCYYGANYYKDWVLDVNSGGTYEQYGMTSKFTADELDMINSEEGYDMYIPSIDGMTTRLVVVGFNDENISNGVDTYEDVLAHPAVDDCTTPYAEAENIVLNPLLHDWYDEASGMTQAPLLDGDWTLTATVLNGGKTEVQKSRVRIKHALEEGVDYPAELPDSVYTLYKEATKGKWTDDEIYGFYEEFKNLAGIYNDKRLYGQNKLLLEGWLDNDSQGRLSLMTPWDMFISRTISTVNVEQMFTEFGPKMHIKVNKDMNGRDSLTVTANRYYCSPVANWSVPFYMAGYANQEANNTIFYYGTTTEFQAPLEFGVELSEDLNTLTIKAIDRNGTLYYPNVIGVDNLSGMYILEKPIISDVVLTRGWSETDTEVEETPALRSVSKSRTAYKVAPEYKPNLMKYSKRSVFEKTEKRNTVKVDYKFVSYDQLMINLENFKNR